MTAVSAGCGLSGRFLVDPRVPRRHLLRGRSAWEGPAGAPVPKSRRSRTSGLIDSLEVAMSLRDRITEDMKSAMRAKDAARLSTIRLLLAAIKQKEVDERIVVDDAQVLAILEKLVKQRRDSIEQFRRGNRQDLVDHETAELAVLAEYQPEQAGADEVSAAIAEAIKATAAKGPSDMGKVMAILKPKLAGRADMAAVSTMVRAALAAPAA
jgi:uncharacterized protein YqeY